MDIYLTAKETDVKLHIPLLPDRLSVKSGANTLPLNVIKTGEIKIPRGTTLTGYSWSSTLPGASMSHLSFIADWQDPKKIVTQLENWKEAGTKLNFMLTETTINDDVFIESFSYEYFGVDNISYTINLTKYRELVVTISPAPPPKSAGVSGGSTGIVTGKKVAYRKGPGTKYKKLGTLKKGTEVIIYGTSGNWYKIKEGSPEWWIKASYVKNTSGASTKTKKSNSKKGGKKKGTVSSNTGNNNSATDLSKNKPTAYLVSVAQKTVKTKTR